MIETVSVVFLLFILVCIAGCCTDETTGPANPPGGMEEALTEQFPEINVSEIPIATPAGSSSDFDGIVARYRAAHPFGDLDPRPTHEPCEDYSKTGEFIEAVGGLFDLIREDPAAGRLFSDGGEIVGVVVVCPPSAASEPGGPGCYPAVRVSYGEVTIDYLVNIDCMRIERASVEVPPGYLLRTVDNATYIVHNGEVVLAL